MAIETRTYSYTDLTPILDKVRENNVSMAEINNSINNTWVHNPKEPSQWDRTVWENAGSNIRDAYKLESAEKNVDKIIEENKKLYKQYQEETDRRNAIINRMWQIRQNIKDWYGSDTKNRLASINMIKRDIKEYRWLREEANKFYKNIKR